jgi:hypothetical protein
VPETLSKGHKALGKAFAECHTRHTSHGKILVSKEDFVECFISGTRQKILGKNEHSAKNKPKKPKKNSKKNLPGEAPTGQRPPVSVEVASRGIFCTLCNLRDSNPRPLPRAYPLYHCTTLSLVSRFRFGSPHIILNRV